MVVAGVVAGLLGAIALALGAQFQNRGVKAVDDADGASAGSGFSVRQFLALFRSPRWLLGTGFVTVAIIVQLVALLLAPLPVVQPLGVLSLVVTALLNRRISGLRMQRIAIGGIGLCVAGITVFVVAAALTTRGTPRGDAAVVPVLVVLAVVLVLIAIAFLAARRHLPAFAFAMGGGVCFGFVATLMKVVLDRCGDAVHQHGTLIDGTTPFTLLVLIAAGVAGSVGTYLVQTAYATGSPDLVVAALTVIDPLVAVTLGIGLLAAARDAPPGVFPVFAAAETVAIAGVVLMARHPPRAADDVGAEAHH